MLLVLVVLEHFEEVRFRDNQTFKWLLLLYSFASYSFKRLPVRLLYDAPIHRLSPFMHPYASENKLTRPVIPSHKRNHRRSVARDTGGIQIFAPQLHQERGH